MLKSITGKIESCTIKKEGNTNGKPWIIYGVTINGEQFSTFDSLYSENIGKEGTYEYEEKINGQYVNKTLSKYPESNVPANSSAAPGSDNVVRVGGILRGDIKKLEEAMNKRFDILASTIDSLSKASQPTSSPESEIPVPEFSQVDNSTDDIPIID